MFISNKIKIEFISSDSEVAKFFPPLPAKKCLPDWYKSLDLYIPGGEDDSVDAKSRLNNQSISNFTIKGCIPVQDYLTSGYLLTMSADVLISPDSSENMYWYSKCADVNNINFHPFSQCPIKIEGERKLFFKINHTWTIRTPPGYSCLFYQPFYLMEERFSLFPAIVDTDKHDVPVFFPGFLKTKKPFKLSAGSPFIAVLPFKRDEWEMEVKLKPKSRSIVHYLVERGYKMFFHSPKKFN